jgi:3'-5' exoribonuclease
MNMAGLQAKMNGSGWQWTEYQRHLERYLYLRAGGVEEELTTVQSDVPEEPQEGDTVPPTEPAPPPRAKKAAPQRQQTLF